MSNTISPRDRALLQSENAVTNLTKSVKIMQDSVNPHVTGVNSYKEILEVWTFIRDAVRAYDPEVAIGIADSATIQLTSPSMAQVIINGTAEIEG